MHLTVRNINDAFPIVIDRFLEPTGMNHYIIDSRNGPVWKLKTPLTITYLKPWERVLFNPIRDCNPFFHLAEAMWMLAGRNDVAFLDHFNKQMKTYSDDGKTFRGAYGYRWIGMYCSEKSYGKIHQLNAIIRHLKEYPDSRRAVLSMWGLDDLLDVYHWTNQNKTYTSVRRGGTPKDIPCNTHAYLQIGPEGLEITVCNRSNDIIWGMLGANIVHFSFLQEYLANAIGVARGPLHQFTTNAHLYTNKYPREKLQEMLAVKHNRDPYMDGILDDTPWPQVCNVFKNDEEASDERIPFTDTIRVFLKDYMDKKINPETVADYNPFIDGVIFPAFLAWDAKLAHKYQEAHYHVNRIKAPDWRCACREWISRSYSRYVDRTEKKRGEEEREIEDQLQAEDTI